MKEVKIKLLDSEGNVGEDTLNFKVPDKATIFDLKKAFTAQEGYTPEQIRLIHRMQDLDVAPDDTDLIDEYQNGQFLVECPSVGLLDGLIKIIHDENVDVLVGSKNFFEHFKLTRLYSGSNLKLPLGMKINFKLTWSD